MRVPNRGPRVQDPPLADRLASGLCASRLLRILKRATALHASWPFPGYVPAIMARHTGRLPGDVRQRQNSRCLPAAEMGLEVLEGGLRLQIWRCGFPDRDSRRYRISRVYFTVLCTLSTFS